MNSEAMALTLCPSGPGSPGNPVFPGRPGAPGRPCRNKNINKHQFLVKKKKSLQIFYSETRFQFHKGTFGFLYSI